MQDKIKDILSELGYKLTECGNGWRTTRVYADGDNPSALSISKDGYWYDFVDNRGGNLSQLVQVTLDLSDQNQAKEWLKNKNINIVKSQEIAPSLKEIKKLPQEWLNQLTPDHSYWMGRGINEEVLKEMDGGIATDKIPRMNGRYCFPVVNSENKLIGLAGRSLNGKLPKYKLLGEKKSFYWGFNVNLSSIKREKRIIINESPGDSLSLSSVGIRCWLCLFGVSLSNEQLSMLLSLSSKKYLDKLIIATNNDGAAGNEAARKIQSRLLKFFDKRQVEIKLPEKKDINDQLMSNGVSSIKEMYN